MQLSALLLTLVIWLPGLSSDDGDVLVGETSDFDSVTGCLDAGARWAAIAAQHWAISPVDEWSGMRGQYYCTETIGDSMFYYPPGTRADLEKTFRYRAEVLARLGLRNDGVTL